MHNLGTKCVAVLLSTFNGSEYVQKCILSLQNQQSVCVHIIARDDGSTDSTVDILSEMLSNEDLLLTDNIHLGTTASFQLLASTALRLDFLWYAFCDQDDVWKAEKLINGLDLLNNRNFSLICTRREFIDSRGTLIDKKDNERSEGLLRPQDLIGINPVVGCTTIFSRDICEIFCDLTLFEYSFHDHVLGLIAASLNRAYYANQSGIFYRIHS